MRLSIGVQHHPSRAELLPPLLAALEPLPADVVVDPDPEGIADAWRSYRPALERTPEWATHRVILQDDVRLCDRFPEMLERVVAAQPDSLVALCVCGGAVMAARHVRRAHARRLAWARLTRATWVPTIALVWPAAVIPRSLAWVDAQNWPRMFRADDEIAGRIANGLKLDVLATVPSIVQHPDLVDSICRRSGRGKSPARVAAIYYDDVSNVDWSLGPR